MYIITLLYVHYCLYIIVLLILYIIAIGVSTTRHRFQERGKSFLFISVVTLTVDPSWSFKVKYSTFWSLNQEKIYYFARL